MDTPRIVALGDSLSQGFAHGAVHRVEWSFPAILARAIAAEHRVPTFPGAGFPLNLDHMLRELAEPVGTTINRLEWLVRVPGLVRRYVDEIEDYYERGAGSTATQDSVRFHNLAISGFTVNEAVTITPSLCRKLIAEAEGWIADDPLGLPSAPIYRGAQMVLNPGGVPAREGETMLDSFRALASEEPVDILLLWFGGNDCLGTVATLEIHDMPPGYRGGDPFERRRFNLTSLEQFRRDYTTLVEKVDETLDAGSGRRQVYVGTVPHVTIPPVTRGVGQFDGGYYDHYARFFRDEHSFDPRKAKSLTRSEAAFIDARIDGYNEIIRELAGARGWAIVETVDLLDELAVKRNGALDDPSSSLRRYLAGRGHPDHPLLALDPIPDVLGYQVAQIDGAHRRVSGGLLSLDLLHPSTMGYGLVAERFLEEIQAHNPSDPALQAARIDWPAVIAQDTLEQSPPVLWDDVMRNAHELPWLWEVVFCLATYGAPNLR